jgi:ubiquinone/menaquinone biosynthesis C-methylase UbiE
MIGQEREQTRAAWDEIAAGYDRFVTEPGRPVAEDALRRAGLQPGMRLLDVATGCGALAIPAARLGAQVVAVDLSPAMIDHLNARARREEISGLEGRVMDGHALDLEDESFDISASQFGVMLFPDLPRGLREMARVTRPGGRVLMVTYAAPPSIDFIRFFIGAMQAAVPGFTGLPTDPPPLPFQVSDPVVLHQRMEEAGLRDVRVESGIEELEIESGKHLWNWVTNSNPIGRMLVSGLTSEQETEVQTVLEQMVRERAGGSGPAILNNHVNIGIGTK